MTKKDMQARLSEIASQVEALAGDDGQIEAIEALLAEGEQLQQDLEALEAAERRRAEVTAKAVGLKKWLKSSPGPVSHPRGSSVVTAVRARWEEDPDAYGYRSANGQPSPRLFLLDVMRAGMHGIESDPLKALKFRAVAGSDEASGAADPYGGYLVPTAFSPQLLRVGVEGDPTVGRTMLVPMTAPAVQIPARTDKNHTTSVSGGLRVYRRAETDTVASSRMEMELITLRAHPLMGLSFASEELLTDSPLSFAAIVEAGFRDEFAAKLLREKLRGTGVGEYLGILNSPCLVSVTRTASGNAIEFADILNVRARVWGYNNAIWLANHDTIPDLASVQLASSSQVVWQPSLREDLPDMLLGRPIFFTEFASSLGTVGDLICGNWSQYLEGQYQQMQGAESIHVRFVNNERTFRFTARNDGQPWWRSALTPAQSASTLSPFVTIAT
jgi:HK97 family phage major capsid protein